VTIDATRTCAKVAGARCALRARQLQGESRMALTILGADDASAHLDALADGEWGIVDDFDRDGRRYVVAIRSPRVRPGRRRLTEREAQVVALVATGRRNREVARELGLGVSTVAGHIAMAMARWGVESRTALVTRWNLVADVSRERRRA
jgi:DNA-binding CsgD family transcriptional regulator